MSSCEQRGDCHWACFAVGEYRVEREKVERKKKFDIVQKESEPKKKT